MLLLLNCCLLCRTYACFNILCRAYRKLQQLWVHDLMDKVCMLLLPVLQQVFPSKLPTAKMMMFWQMLIWLLYTMQMLIWLLSMMQLQMCNTFSDKKCCRRYCVLGYEASNADLPVAEWHCWSFGSYFDCNSHMTSSKSLQVSMQQFAKCNMWGQCNKMQHR